MEEQPVSDVARQLRQDEEFIRRLAERLEAHNKPRWDRWGVLVVLALNVGALVWGASQLSGAVENNQETSRDNTVLIRQSARLLSDLEARMRVVEDRTRRVP